MSAKTIVHVKVEKTIEEWIQVVAYGIEDAMDAAREMNYKPIKAQHESPNFHDVFE